MHYRHVENDCSTPYIRRMNMQTAVKKWKLKKNEKKNDYKKQTIDQNLLLDIENKRE